MKPLVLVLVMVYVSLYISEQCGGVWWWWRRMGLVMGLPSVENYVKILDSKNKYSKLLKEVR